MDIRNRHYELNGKYLVVGLPFTWSPQGLNSQGFIMAIKEGE